MSKYPLRQPPAGWQLYYHAVPDLAEPVLGARPAGWYLLHQWQFAAGPFSERWYAVQVAERMAARKRESDGAL